MARSPALKIIGMITRDAPRVLHVIMLSILPGHLRESIGHHRQSATSVPSG